MHEIVSDGNPIVLELATPHKIGDQLKQIDKLILYRNKKEMITLSWWYFVRSLNKSERRLVKNLFFYAEEVQIYQTAT